MKKSLLTVFVTLLLLVSACTPNAEWLQHALKKTLINMAWDDAIRLSRYSGDGIPQPLVRWSPQVGKIGAYGLYGGDRTVYLNDELLLTSKRSKAYNTLVHEMVHYLQVQEGRAGMNGGVMACIAEEEAFEVSALSALELGVPEWDRRLTWHTYYRGC